MKKYKENEGEGVLDELLPFRTREAARSPTSTSSSLSKAPRRSPTFTCSTPVSPSSPLPPSLPSSPMLTMAIDPELGPPPNRSPPFPSKGGSQIVTMDPSNATPQTTLNSEAGKKFLSRLQANGFASKSSFKLGEGQLTPVYRTISSTRSGGSKVFPGRVRKRVILKNGNVNLCKEHVDKRSQRYVQDLFTTMVDIQWRWNLLAFAMGFFLSWLGFAVIWWLICLAHGDFEHIGDDKWTPCVDNVNSFTSAFLFSIETQHTIGYGSRYTTEECPEAIFIMCLQSITGVVIQCFVVGFVFAKLSRPQKRSQTLLFSKTAVVNLRDGKLSLMFRIGDVRERSHIIGASIKAQMISRKVTLEGEVVPYYHTILDVKFDDADDGLFLIWPVTVVHQIDDNSPFYNMSADEMAREKFEIVLILEGTIESTGQSIQARTSYLPCEILWGHRFEQMITYRRETGEYLVDYAKFNASYEIDTPMCSAKDYYDYVKYLESQKAKEAKITPYSDIASVETGMTLRTSSAESQNQNPILMSPSSLPGLRSVTYQNGNGLGTPTTPRHLSGKSNSSE